MKADGKPQKSATYEKLCPPSRTQFPRCELKSLVTVTFRPVIFFFGGGGTCNLKCTPTNHEVWTDQKRLTRKKCTRSIEIRREEWQTIQNFTWEKTIGSRRLRRIHSVCFVAFFASRNWVPLCQKVSHFRRLEAFSSNRRSCHIVKTAKSNRLAR